MKNGYKRDYKLEEQFFQHRDLRELLRYSAETYKDKDAFITKQKNKKTGEVRYKHTSFQNLFDEMNALGTALVELGCQGKRIAILGENSYYWILSYYTTVCGAGIAVPLDKGLPKEELESCLNRVNCEVIFYDKKHAKLVDSIFADGNTNLSVGITTDFIAEGKENIEMMIARGGILLRSGETGYVDAEIDPDEMRFLLFTSGTTSQSKIVMLSHRNLTACNYGMSLRQMFLPDDVNMIILPLHHIYGFSGLLMFVSHGVTSVFCDGLKYITINMKEYGVSVITSVPLLLENMYKKIWKAIDKNGQREKIEKALKACDAADKVGINLRKRMFKQIIEQFGGRMRMFTNGAAPLDAEVQKGLNDFGILTVQGYGLTETAPTLALETHADLKAGTTGKIMPNIEARLDDVDEEGVGELVVRGESVMLGYYENPEATAEVLEEDGWFHTGDLATIDAEGFVTITGRKKNVIVMKNGKNVFPEEAENLINQLPYVEESMVFTQNKQNDVVLWAKVVYDKNYLKEQNLTLEELEKKLDADMTEINATMPQYKMVKRYYLSDKPTIKTTTMKTKRREEMKVVEKEIADMK